MAADNLVMQRAGASVTILLAKFFIIAEAVLEGLKVVKSKALYV